MIDQDIENDYHFVQ